MHSCPLAYHLLANPGLHGGSVETVPTELAWIFDQDPASRRAFETLSSIEKRDLLRWIDSAPDADRRRQRIDMVIRSLR